MLLDQGFNTRPELGVAFALHVAGGEDAVPKRVFGALRGTLFIVHEVVSQNHSLCRVGRDDSAAAMDDAFGLVEVDGFGNVVWDDGVVLPQLGDAIDLNGEANGNTGAAQIAGKRHGCGRSPALAEEHDVGALSFVLRQDAVVIRVEQANDGLEGLFSATIFEDSNVSTGRDGLANSLGEQDGGVMGIIVIYESADESDDDVGWGGRRIRHGAGGVGGL